MKLNLGIEHKFVHMHITTKLTEDNKKSFNQQILFKFYPQILRVFKYPSTITPHFLFYTNFILHLSNKH